MGRDEGFHRRLTVITGFMLLISAVLIARLLSFQFRMDPAVKSRLESQAQNRYSQTVEVYPNRGQIYDRNGNLLAVNSFEYRIGISPNQVVNRAETARKLAPLIDVPEDEIYRKLQPGPDGKLSTYVLLKPVVGFEAGQAIMDLELPGMVIEPLPTRIYPEGELTAQLVGIFRDSDASRTRRGYWGVEGFYQTLLAGQSKKVTTSAIPVLQEAASITRVRDGIDLVLTIDRDLQFLAQEILNWAVQREQATGGTILIMNPRTGEILAIANYPMFDPNSLTPENIQRARNPAIAAVSTPAARASATGTAPRTATRPLSMSLSTRGTPARLPSSCRWRSSWADPTPSTTCSKSSGSAARPVWISKVKRRASCPNRATWTGTRRSSSPLASGRAWR